ncbi:MAG: metal ABC transporter substrate-binding protein [Dehalococcoidia bacterium]
MSDLKPVAQGKKLSVIATTTQVADFVRNVVGDKVTLTGLVAPNQDPHEFEPKPQDVQQLNSAGMIFKNGAGLESGFRKFLNGVPGSVPIIDTSAGVKTRKGQKESVDPHIWHDPLNAKIMVNTIRDALKKRDPANAAVYQENALTYTQQIDQLDADIRGQFDGVPAAKRKLVANHDAFGYFVARYGITFVGSVIPSLDTNTEPSPKDTADLVNKIKAEHVCAIFTESSINPKLEQQIAGEAGVKIYSNLYGDTLGPPGSDGETYLKMEAANTKNMVAGMTAC